MEQEPYKITGKAAVERANQDHFTAAAFCIDELIKHIYHKCGYKSVDTELWFGNPENIINRRSRAYNKDDHAFIILRDGENDSSDKLEPFLDKLSAKSKQQIDAYFPMDNPQFSPYPKTVIIDVTPIAMNPQAVWDVLKADINRRTFLKGLGNGVGVAGVALLLDGLRDTLSVMRVPARNRNANADFKTDCELGVGVAMTIGGFAAARHAASSIVPTEENIKLSDMNATAKRWRLRSDVAKTLYDQGIDMLIDHPPPDKSRD